MLLLPRVHWAIFQAAKYDAVEALTAREAMLLHVEAGRIEIELEERVLCTESAQILVLPTGASYTQKTSNGTHSVLVCFAPYQFDFDESPRVIEASNDEFAVRWMRELALLQGQNNRHREIADHLLAALLARLKQMERRDAALKALHPVVASVVEWIDHNIAESTTLEALALHAHCSPSHLRALFKQQVGSGIMRYQQDRRMQYALELLDQPHLSLSDIAKSCGYQDVEYFSRLFRRYHHMPPGRLRSRKQSAANP